jgi:hypothetical protein
MFQNKEYIQDYLQTRTRYKKFIKENLEQKLMKHVWSYVKIGKDVKGQWTLFYLKCGNWMEHKVIILNKIHMK